VLFLLRAAKSRFGGSCAKQSAEGQKGPTARTFDCRIVSCRYFIEVVTPPRLTNEPSLRTTTTDLIETAESGDDNALNQLIPIVYEELRILAHRQLAHEQRHDSLQTTALVHEVYLRLVDDTRVTQRGRAYFFAAVSRAMRQILVDRARRRLALKRGEGAEVASLDENQVAIDTYAAELVELDEALKRLAGNSVRHARVVELRFFAGLSVAQTAEVLGVSPRTVKSDWAMARAWLFSELGSHDLTARSDKIR
jgi:RNA polymerase sigma factor (TIGR02999 family)